MDAPSSYAAAVAGIAERLRHELPSYANLNRAAGQIDHLGRLLHGLDCVRHVEIAASMMAAVAALQESTELPEPARTEGVARAVAQLETALIHIGAGTTE
jgi:hypothetical protein